jgi:superoxide dismutase, Cu-Zn family
MFKMTALATAACLAAGTATAQDAAATLQNTDGDDIGTATLTETANGLTLVVVEAEGVPAGTHGVHVHETGDCSAGDFSSAGGHLAGNADHGVMVEGGPHPGDMPNAHVQDDGTLAIEVFQANLPLDLVLDADGSAVVVHSGADDYESQPSGDAGDRIACGVIEQG